MVDLLNYYGSDAILIGKVLLPRALHLKGLSHFYLFYFEIHPMSRKFRDIFKLVLFSYMLNRA